MAGYYDDSDFVDTDYQTQKGMSPSAQAVKEHQPSATASHAPTREELNKKVSEAQAQLAALQQEQEELERQRIALEESRRRQAEFQTGRQEMNEHLVRGIGILEESEFRSRQAAEQMSKTLAALREAKAKVSAIHEEMWTKENYEEELTKALTTIENARMEWNAAQLKWDFLSGSGENTPGREKLHEKPLLEQLQEMSFKGLCKIGFALTWPLAAAALAAFIVMLIFVLQG
ncbi:MAG: hypothetical protein K9N48_05080 [Verrucomicrobia bacterium]|nr:hypothetical protein [Verrucomicrobiota bacterium]MCF7707928.1 hypothetical protein [Verrucomicrobiota bacterium]